MTLSLTPQQQAILQQLGEGDRYRADLLATTENDYQVLQQALAPLIQQGLITYRFEEDAAQRFHITFQGREAIETFACQ